MAAAPPKTPAGIEDALAAARPAMPEGGARRMRMRAVMASVLGPELAPPMLGRYVVEAKVASGGMGVVFRGHDPDGGQPVAIKLLNASAAAERPRFTREALILRSIVHPHVVRYLDHGVEDGLDYLVMEWLEGRDLASRLARGPLAEHDALRAALHVAQALDAAHRAGITHRDVKPSNVFLIGDRLEDLRLIDFGIARSARPSHPGTRLTASGAVLGSPHYMAPEQLRGEHDARTDVYALGATLFECLAGRPPFGGAHPAAILLAVLAEPVPSVSALRSEVSPALDALLGRMLAKDMRDRPRDMAAVITELSGLFSRPEQHARVLGAVTRAERSRSTTRAARPAALGIEPALVGRVREMAEIRGLLAESLTEEMASLVAVTGDAGSGKSKLVRALSRRQGDDDSAAGPGDWVVFGARGDGAGVPFSTLRGLVASAPDQAEPASERLLALIVGLDARREQRRIVGASVDLLADPLVIADRLLLAWLELLEAWSARGPLLFVLDDVHRADLSSLRFIDRALRHLQNRCFVVLAAARTSEDLKPLGTTLEEGRALVVHLGPLRQRAAESLAESLCGDAAPDVVAEVARLSAGNPARLVELARRARDGLAPGAGSMADLLWARLDRLGLEERRVLRAASIIGRTVWPSAVAALIGVEPDDSRLLTRLAMLVADGYLAALPASGRSSEPRLEFTSELLQLAVHDLCTEEDLRSGHEVMARWLIETSAAGGAVVARHLVLAGNRQEALPHFVAAARAALAGDQPELFDALLREADACVGGARTAELFAGELTEVRVQGAFWRGRIDQALSAALTGLDGLTPRSEAWFRVTSLAITAAGQLGDNARVHELAGSLVALTEVAGAARDARITGLCRAYTQLEGIGGPMTGAIWSALDGAEEVASDPEARAWVARARATASGRRSFDDAIGRFVEAHRAHLAAGDLRSAAQIGLYLGSFHVWSGAWEQAGESIEDALRVAGRLGADYLTLWGRYVRGKLEVETESYETASANLEAVAARAASSPRIRAGALVYGAVAAQRAGRFDVAESWARSALALAPALMVLRAGSAALCRALLSQRRVAEAAALASALAPRPELGVISELDELVMLARAELAHASVSPPAAVPHALDPEGGSAALTEAITAIETRAATLASPLRRNNYLGRPHLVVRTLELARGGFGLATSSTAQS